MTLSIEATYDGRAFLPTNPIRLRPNTRVQLSVEIENANAPVSFFEVAQSLKLDGPPDWSKNLDKYLYGDVTDGS